MDSASAAIIEAYALNAQRTENIPTLPKTLLSREGFVLALALKAASDLGEQLNRMKRAIFYGQTQNLDDVLVKLPDCKLEHSIGTSTLTPQQMRLLHASLGFITEAIEFSEAVSAHVFDGKAFDEVHAMEELGDLFWYSAIPVNLFGWSYAAVMQANIDKLRARYPDRWTQENALERDLSAERQALEAGQTPQPS